MKRLASRLTWWHNAPQGNSRSTPQKERPSHGHIGIDVHKRESQICILAAGGELIEQRIRTESGRFAAVQPSTHYRIIPSRGWPKPPDAGGY